MLLRYIREEEKASTSERLKHIASSLDASYNKLEVSSSFLFSAKLSFNDVTSRDGSLNAVVPVQPFFRPSLSRVLESEKLGGAGVSSQRVCVASRRLAQSFYFYRHAGAICSGSGPGRPLYKKQNTSSN